jgi:hypothetical protein
VLTGVLIAVLAALIVNYLSGIHSASPGSQVTSHADRYGKLAPVSSRARGDAGALLPGIRARLGPFQHTGLPALPRCLLLTARNLPDLLVLDPTEIPQVRVRAAIPHKKPTDKTVLPGTRRHG